MAGTSFIHYQVQDSTIYVCRLTNQLSIAKHSGEFERSNTMKIDIWLKVQPIYMMFIAITNNDKSGLDVDSLDDCH